MDQAPIDVSGLLDRVDQAMFILSGERQLVFANEALLSRLGVSDLPTLAEQSAFLQPPAELPSLGVLRMERPWDIPKRCWYHLLFVHLSDERGDEVGTLGFLHQGRAPVSVPKAPSGEPDERLERLRDQLRLQGGFEAIPARGPLMRRVVQQVRLACGAKEPVGLIGPTGSGKETLARVIHRESPFARGSFSVVDAAAMPPELQRQTLLGSGRLVAPDESATVGLLDSPFSGTLLVKNVTQLAPNLQQALAERQQEANLPWRLIVTEKRSPEDLLTRGELAEPLYHLMSILTIDVPALAKRPLEFEDHCLLALEQLRTSKEQATPVIEASAMELLREYHWPGNLRELRQVLEQALARQPKDENVVTIARSSLPRRLRRSASASGLGIPEPATPKLGLAELLSEVERRLIDVALAESAGNKAAAARLLKISRASLHRRCDQLGVGVSSGDESSSS
ncbi:Arginine utilization regulatory protein RocR [Planctomycetes bacterium Pan216]|uniref:Arginine utilization regulatory protein RocR n=1 Tax=Kolteria novifilia TaxID=2527975 RepID=A0A518B1N5_9BACT|nr:Arginine utilization regulatory protein RocR [Planctomycetes bacterium Pan216]